LIIPEVKAKSENYRFQVFKINSNFVVETTIDDKLPILAALGGYFKRVN